MHYIHFNGGIFVGVVKKDHGVQFLKKIHEKKLREIQRKITREERQDYIDELENKNIEISGCKKLESSAILRILSEKECPVCGTTVYPPRIYCDVCRPPVKKQESSVAVNDSVDTFECEDKVDKFGIRDQV